MAKKKPENNTISSETIDLASVLSSEVNVIEKPTFSPEENAFDEVIMDPEPEQIIIQMPNNGENGNYQQDGPEPKHLTPDDLAIIGVNILDGIQRFAFAFARKKYVFTDEELELLNTLDQSDKVIYPAGSREAVAMAKFKKHLEVVKTLPFDPGEKQRLTDATIIYARTQELKVTPLQGLLLAYSEVLGTRAITVFSE